MYPCAASRAGLLRGGWLPSPDRELLEQQICWSGWAREELNLRPLPCQLTRAYRCANRRFPRSRSTVDGKVKCCLVERRYACAERGRGCQKPPGHLHSTRSLPMSLGSLPALTCTDSYCAQPTPYQEPSGPSGRRTRLSRARLGKATGVPRGADDPQGPNRPGAGGFARRPPGRSSWGSSLSRPKFGPSSPGAHARICLPAALHEVGSPAAVASLPTGGAGW